MSRTQQLHQPNPSVDRINRAVILEKRMRNITKRLDKGGMAIGKRYKLMAKLASYREQYHHSDR